MNQEADREATLARLGEAVRSGDARAAMLHAADAGLSAKDFLAAFGDVATTLARKFEADAVKVAESVKGVEDIAGGNSYELERAAKLRELASSLILASENS